MSSPSVHADAAGAASHGRVDGRTAVLRGLLVFAIAESVVHYVDNTIRWTDYAPSSGLIPRWLVPLSWVAFTAAGLYGYRCYRTGRFPQAAAWVAAYTASGLISVLHFVTWKVGSRVLFPGSHLDTFQVTFVWLDVAAGVALLAFAFRTALDPPDLTAVRRR